MCGRPICVKCKRNEVEQIDDWQSSQCSRCNDRSIERLNEQREWDYFHSEQHTTLPPTKESLS